MRKIKWHFKFEKIEPRTLDWFARNTIHIQIGLSNGEIYQGYCVPGESSIIDIGLPRMDFHLINRKHVKLHVIPMGLVSRNELIIYKLRNDIPF